MSALAVRPLSAALGVEVDLDLDHELPPEARREFRDLFLESHLLLVRSAGMSVEQSIRICSYVAPVFVQDGVAPHAYVSNSRGYATLPDSEIPWHADMNFNARPHLGASLYAEEADDLATPTCFANACRAASLLPERLRVEVAPIKSLHEVPTVVGVSGMDTAAAPTLHPVLWEHPITHQALIYVADRQRWQHRVLQSVSPEVEDRLLTELFSYLYRADNVYVHHWQPGDLIIWDNVALQHRRDATSGLRTLRRLALVEGSTEGDPYFALQAMLREHVRVRSRTAERQINCLHPNEG